MALYWLVQRKALRDSKAKGSSSSRFRGCPRFPADRALRSDLQGHIYAATSQGLFISKGPNPGIVSSIIQIQARLMASLRTGSTSIRATPYGSVADVLCALSLGIY